MCKQNLNGGLSYFSDCTRASWADWTERVRPRPWPESLGPAQEVLERSNSTSFILVSKDSYFGIINWALTNYILIRPQNSKRFTWLLTISLRFSHFLVPISSLVSFSPLFDSPFPFCPPNVHLTPVLPFPPLYFQSFSFRPFYSRRPSSIIFTDIIGKESAGFSSSHSSFPPSVQPSLSQIIRYSQFINGFSFLLRFWHYKFCLKLNSMVKKHFVLKPLKRSVSVLL